MLAVRQKVPKAKLWTCSIMKRTCNAKLLAFGVAALSVRFFVGGNEVVSDEAANISVEDQSVLSSGLQEQLNDLFIWSIGRYIRTRKLPLPRTQRHQAAVLVKVMQVR